MRGAGSQLAKELGKEQTIRNLIREWEALIDSMESGDLGQGYFRGRKPQPGVDLTGDLTGQI
jgi:hypothetical protein